jgi:hypothetical protein
MKEVVPSDSRYVPVTQQRYCCVPACIQIVMLKHRIPLIPQELLGYYLGLIVPKEDLQYFWNARTGKKPKSGYGTQIFYKKEFEANNAFKKLHIPLKMNYKFIDKFKSLKAFTEYLNRIEIENKDVLTCFDYGTLHKTNYHYGHVSIIDRVYKNKGKVRLVDPERNVPKWRIVEIKKLFDAMKRHGKENGGGFWILSKE